jgi:LCP family protein required for cell wall assembly
VAASSSSPWRAFVHRYVIALGVAFVLVMSGLLVGNRLIDAKLGDLHRVRVAVAAEGPAQAGNYLIVGSDSRQFVQDAQQRSAFGDPSVESGQRSDTLMVLHLDPDTKQSLLVSFPRDLQVDIPGVGTSKINAAFNSGPTKLVETFKSNFDVDISHYVEVSFDAFPAIVDAIGKVPVYFDAAYRDRWSGLSIPGAGCVQLDGQAALGYVRSRHLERFDPKRDTWVDASGASDLDRIGRQQTFIRKLAALAAAKTASNPLKAFDLADAIVPKLKVDNALSKNDILRLVKVFRNVDPNSSSAVEMVTIPTRQQSSSSNLLLQQPAAAQLLARLRTFGQTASPDQVAKVRPAQVKVRVLNGSGANGAAGRALASFQRYGFTPADVGNVAATATTEIRYAKGAEAKAALVQSYLGGTAVLTQDDSLVGADVAVVLGANYAGVSKPGGPASSTTSTTAGKGTTPKSSTPAAPTC